MRKGGARRLNKEEEGTQLHQQGRELMNAWKSSEAGRPAPLPIIVQVENGKPSVHSGVNETAFNEH